MKKIGLMALCLVFLASTSIVQAQDPETGLYRSFFGEESSSWNGVTEYWDCYPENVWMGIVGDTMLEGIIYKKIHSTTGDFLLREDRLNGRLWCRYWDTQNGDTEFLVADLSLSTNDTISLLTRNYVGVIYPKRVLYQVTDTMSTEYGRTVILKSTRTYPYPRIIRFIEGIGGTNLFDCLQLLSITNQVICYHKDGDLVYHESYWDYPEENCKLIRVGLDGVSEKRAIRIWPNPCEDWFIIKGDHTLVAELHDIMGHGIIENIVPYKKIDTGDLPRGVYLLRVKLNGSIITKKIVIK